MTRKWIASGIVLSIVAVSGALGQAEIEQAPPDLEAGGARRR